MISGCVTAFKDYQVEDFKLRIGKLSCDMWINFMPGFDFETTVETIILHELDYLGSRTYVTPSCHTSREALANVLINIDADRSHLELFSELSLTCKRRAKYVAPLTNVYKKPNLLPYKRMRFFA